MFESGNLSKEISLSLNIKFQESRENIFRENNFAFL